MRHFSCKDRHCSVTLSDAITKSNIVDVYNIGDRGVRELRCRGVGRGGQGSVLWPHGDRC